MEITTSDIILLFSFFCMYMFGYYMGKSRDKKTHSKALDIVYSRAYDAGRKGGSGYQPKQNRVEESEYGTPPQNP